MAQQAQRDEGLNFSAGWQSVCLPDLCSASAAKQSCTRMRHFGKAGAQRYTQSQPSTELSSSAASSPGGVRVPRRTAAAGPPAQAPAPRSSQPGAAARRPPPRPPAAGAAGAVRGRRTRRPPAAAERGQPTRCGCGCVMVGSRKKSDVKILALCRCSESERGCRACSGIAAEAACGAGGAGCARSALRFHRIRVTERLSRFATAPRYPRLGGGVGWRRGGWGWRNSRRGGVGGGW
jgi:hypothetical protein